MLGDNDVSCRLISCSKCITLVGEVGNNGASALEKAGSMWEISVPSLRFAVNLKVL